MNSRLRTAIACLLTLPMISLSACDGAENVTSQPATEKPDPAQAAAAIEEAQKARIAALNSGDVDGAVSVYAPDATLVLPNEQPLTDPASIRANYASLLGDDTVKLEITPTKTWVSAGADFAITTAKINLRTSATEPPSNLESNNQSVWQRQPNGSWKIVSEYSVALPVAKPETSSDGAAANAPNSADATPAEKAESLPAD